MNRLEVTDLTIRIGSATPVKKVSFSVPEGTRVCLLGESGSGKTLTANAVLGLLPSHASVEGSIKIDGMEVLGVPLRKRPDSARVSMVFQDSAVALNPLVSVGRHLIEPLRSRRGLSRAAAIAAAVELADAVGLPQPETVLSRHPSELSGGQRQRVCIALALASTTPLLLADEPTTALDVVTQQKILNVLRRYTAGADSPSLLFITHDFAVAAELCDQAVVMKDGEAIDTGCLREILADPQHAYTARLVSAARAATVDQAVVECGDATTASAQPRARSDGGSLEVHEVSRRYPVLPRRRLLTQDDMITALHPTSLTIAPGERLGIVGASGSGKSTLLKVMLALESPDSGTVTYDKRRVSPSSVRNLRWYRRRVQYVPQDPSSTLDPLMTVRALVAEPIVRLHVPCEVEPTVVGALASVGLDERYLDRRAGELSGGQAQRVALARAIATSPDFLLADEPVSGLDLPMRETVIALLRRIADERGTGIVLVSHDIAMVAGLCDRTVVMNDGAIVEDRTTADILVNPHHPRTHELLAAIPRLDSDPFTIGTGRHAGGGTSHLRGA